MKYEKTKVVISALELNKKIRSNFAFSIKGNKKILKYNFKQEDVTQVGKNPYFTNSLMNTITEMKKAPSIFEIVITNTGKNNETYCNLETRETILFIGAVSNIFAPNTIEIVTPSKKC